MKIKDLCINQNKTIIEAMKTVDQAGLGIAFTVDENNKFTGVISDGDIRKAILRGIELKTPVKEIANKSPITSDENWNEKVIIEILKRKDVRKKMPEYGAIRIPVLNKKNEVVDILFASLQRCESYLKSKEKIKEAKPVRRVLVVGGAGYLGSVLCRKLLKKDYFVRVLDNLTYGDEGIKNLYNHEKFEFIKGDMRDIQTVVDAVKDVDAVVHLAAIVGDPASALDPEETIEINYFGTKLLAEICKYSQINRFLFASTCSVYGANVNPGKLITEESELNPVSLYAEMKLKSENGILEISDGNFSPTILRMSTLFGKSSRMRFDLVVNILAIKALKEKKYTIFGGEQWRPNLHVSDAADAYIKCLEYPINKIRSEVFNVGSNDGNYKIIEVGRIIKNLIPDAEMIVDKENTDKRDYNVSFDKIQNYLNYKVNYTVKDGVNEIKEAVEKGKFNDYTHEKYSNYRFLTKKTNIV